MKYYKLTIKEIFKVLNTRSSGLTNAEASNILEKEGKNIIEDTKGESKLKKFLNEFNNLMIIILLISGVVSFIISYINKEPYTDSIIIVVIVILNAFLGCFQELKADKALEKLKKMQTFKVKVKRDNKVYVINSEDIVKGDILLLEAGERVPADARIIWSLALKVDESVLTGESVPVEKKDKTLKKDVSLSERNNMIYTGTNIVYGKCQAVVCETGLNTEFGKIAKYLKQEEKEITPLQNHISEISKFLSIGIFFIVFIIFIIGLLKNMDLMETIMLSVSLAVAAIPEGLPAVITITLSLGVSSMAKKNAIVRKMSSVETLGTIEVICSDKTGTITQNKMKVREVLYNSKVCESNEIEKDCILLDAMALDNDVEKTEDKYIGDPTEIALYEVCEEYFDVEKIKKDKIRVGEIPFSSERKMMTTINKYDDNYRIYTKGCFDSIIKHCKYIYENGHVKKLTKEKRLELIKFEHDASSKAYRVLAFAYKEEKIVKNIDSSLEEELIFIGFSFMIDPPREDVKEAIRECKKAHIKPIMITGDSLQTAISIAKEIGIIDEETEAITGELLDKMDKKQFEDTVSKCKVYARVSPENKLNIVKVLKEKGKIVAMTGDGVNDAPAIKNANIGIGMGITGTDISKNVSDIILADDSFSTIVTAVKEGRKIFDNIRNVLVYLLTGNIAEVIVVFLGMIFGVEIFLPIQLLYINLITDSIPAIALAFENCSDEIMSRDVRKSSQKIFTPFLISKMTFSSILKTISILLIYISGNKLYGIEVATTMAFLTLTFSEMIYSYSCRNLKESIFGKRFFENRHLNRSILILLVIQLIVFLTPIKIIFKLVDLTFVQTTYCLIIVILLFLVDELSKKIFCKYFKD